MNSQFIIQSSTYPFVHKIFSKFARKFKFFRFQDKVVKNVLVIWSVHYPKLVTNSMANANVKTDLEVENVTNAKKIITEIHKSNVSLVIVIQGFRNPCNVIVSQENVYVAKVNFVILARKFHWSYFIFQLHIAKFTNQFIMQGVGLNFSAKIQNQRHKCFIFSAKIQTFIWIVIMIFCTCIFC